MRLAFLTIATGVLPLLGQNAGSSYAGSAACAGCHASQFNSQSKTGHAHALRRSEPTDPGPGSHAQWAFGAGAKARTWVSQTGEDTIAEHGLTYYAVTKTLGITPGHTTSADRTYRTFDPVGTALRCFRCHSTGPVTLAARFKVEPGEPGIHCEACHGPGLAHAESGGAGPIQNPGRLTAFQINVLCGACHRQSSDLDDDTDWSNPWNVRHQPSYLHRAACFRNSKGALSCITCHDPHQPLKTTAAAYDAKCVACHPKRAHTVSIAARSCVSCHMPQTAASPNLKFTNHWIGIYDPRRLNLMPVKRAVQDLQPVPAQAASTQRMILPADPSTLVPVYAKAVAERERESGANSAKVARAAADLGAFLLETGNSADAEAPLRRAVLIDESNSDPALQQHRESLARVLEARGKREEALSLFRKAAEGKDPAVAARCYAELAALDPENAAEYYRNAAASEEKSSGANSPRLGALLQEYALTLRSHGRDPEAEPLLRRALTIRQNTPAVTIGILNTLGNLLEGLGHLDEAEKLERKALALSEEKFGPESTQLATTCTNLADVLWNKKNLRDAGLLYRRAIGIDAALYGPDRPETAADIANLGMLMKEAGQLAPGEALLRQALAIYESTLGAGSDQARFVRERLAR
ncbi:MAG: tetratricopeptide repeat protein [Terriglobia bacterium]